MRTEKKDETCAVEPEIRLQNSVARQSAGSKAIRGVSVLLCLKVFQWYLLVLQEMESKAGKNEEQYKHFFIN